MTISFVIFTHSRTTCLVGYVQGMSDLCAPIYVVCGADEVQTFWCFVQVMDHMVGYGILILSYQR